MAKRVQFIGTANVPWFEEVDHVADLVDIVSVTLPAELRTDDGLKFTWMETSQDNVSVTVQGDSMAAVEHVIDQLNDGEPTPVIAIITD